VSVITCRTSIGAVAAALRPRVGEEAPDRVVQPLRLAQHDVHELRLVGRERQLLPQDLDRARHGGQRVADLVGDPRGHLADRGQPLLHARLALALARLGDVLEGEQEAGLAARGDERRGADPHLDLPAVGRVKPYSTRGGLPARLAGPKKP
jgi:hypothetical protein